MSDDGGRRGSRPRTDRPAVVVPPTSRWRALVELFALTGFAITQPLLELFGRGTEQFALRGASAAQIVLFGLTVTVVPTLALWSAELAVGWLRRGWGDVLHRVWLALLVAVFAIQAGRPLVTGAPLFVLALLLAVGAVVAYGRLRAVRLWLAFAALAPPGFLLLFLFASPTADLIHEDAGAAAIQADPTPVVMLVFDELPLATLIDETGAIDGELFPGFAALADDAHWYRNATTVTPSTWHALPALLTGQYPEKGDGAPGASDHPDSLFTMLGESHEMNVNESVTRLCPSSICQPTTATGTVWRGLAGDALRAMRTRLAFSRDPDDPTTGFAELADPSDAGADAEAADLDDAALPQPERLANFVDGFAEDGPVLHFLHLLLPHVPYRFLPSGQLYDGPEPDFGRLVEIDQWGDQRWPTVVGRQRHILQTMFVDRLLTEVLDGLRDAGIYDDALVVVAADHGISFEPDRAIRSIEGQALTDESVADLLWVPLFVKEPGQAQGSVSDENVLTVDVLPTIADVLGVDVPWEMDGRSTLGAPRESSTKPFLPNDVNPFGVDVLDRVAVDGAAGWQRVLARSLGAFLPGGDPDRLWNLGPAPELVGRTVSQAGARLAPVEVDLLDPAALEGQWPPGRIPALVRASAGDLAAGAPVALALDGTVVATGEAFTYGDEQQVAFMVEPRWLDPDGVEAVVYALRE